MSYSDVQRERIVRDIVNNMCESSHLSNDLGSEDDFDAKAEELRELSDSNLKSFWESWVGEWLCSIGSEYPSFIESWESVEDEFDNPADWQFEKLLNNGKVNYSYNYPMYSSNYEKISKDMFED